MFTVSSSTPKFNDPTGKVGPNTLFHTKVVFVAFLSQENEQEHIIKLYANKQHGALKTF